jgi:hypothetical protein
MLFINSLLDTGLTVDWLVTETATLFEKLLGLAEVVLTIRILAIVNHLFKNGLLVFIFALLRLLNRCLIIPNINISIFGFVPELVIRLMNLIADAPLEHGYKNK